jgi:hypothetical protein
MTSQQLNVFYKFPDQDGSASFTLNGMMVAAVLIATVTFSAMILPPGGVIAPSPPQPGCTQTNTTLQTTPPVDHLVGHAAILAYDHPRAATAIMVLVYASFSLALCSLMLSLAALEMDPSRQNQGYLCRKRRCLSDWRATYMLASMTLVLATLCAYGAFVAASAITFDAAFNSRESYSNKAWQACTAVSVSAVALCAVWLLVGPFSVSRCVVRAWDKSIPVMLRPRTNGPAYDESGVGSPNATCGIWTCCCLPIGEP